MSPGRVLKPVARLVHGDDDTPFPWRRAIALIAVPLAALVFGWPLVLVLLGLGGVWFLAWVVLVNAPDGTQLLSILLIFLLLIAALAIAVWWCLFPWKGYS